MKCRDRPEVMLNNGTLIKYGYWPLPVCDFWSHKPLPKQRFGWGFWVWNPTGYGGWEHIGGNGISKETFRLVPSTESECRNGILQYIKQERQKARFRPLTAIENRELKRLKRLFVGP